MHFTNEFRVSVPVDQAWAVLTSLERIAPCMPGAELTGVEGDEYSGTIRVKLGPVTAQYKGVATFESLDPATHQAVLKANGRETRGQGNASATVAAQLVPDGDSTVVTVETDLTITGKVAQFGRGMIADVSNKLLKIFATNLEAELAADSLAPEPAAPAEAEGATPAAAASDAEAGTATPSGASGAEGAVRTPGSETAPEAAAEADATAAATDTAGAGEAGAPAGTGDAGGTEAPGTERAPARRRTGGAEPIDLLEVAGAAVLKRAIPAVVVLVLLVVVVVLVVR